MSDKNNGNLSTEAFHQLYRIIDRLRGPDGCPWDKEQTPETLRASLLEEAYETVDAIDRGDGPDIREEIGDLYLVLTLVAYIYEQNGQFSIASILEGLCEKLIRRHPHVFGERTTLSSSEVVDQWQTIKVEVEGKRKKESILDSVATFLPPLERAYKLQKKASKVGFDWPGVAGVLEKIHEEAQEVADIADAAENAADRLPDHERAELEGELGDLLFSVVNLARFMGVDPSLALNRTNEKFMRRFRSVESEMGARGLPLTKEHLKEMDEIWDQGRH